MVIQTFFHYKSYSIDEVSCIRRDGKAGYCMKPNNCTQILNILAERKNKIYKYEHFEYIKNSRSTKWEHL